MSLKLTFKDGSTQSHSPNKPADVEFEEEKEYVERWSRWEGKFLLGEYGLGCLSRRLLTPQNVAEEESSRTADSQKPAEEERSRAVTIPTNAGGVPMWPQLNNRALTGDQQLEVYKAFVCACWCE